MNQGKGKRRTKDDGEWGQTTDAQGFACLASGDARRVQNPQKKRFVRRERHFD